MKASQKQELLRQYAMRRLRDEIAANKRGHAAHIARKSHLTTAHIAQLKKGLRSIGDDALVKLLDFWGIKSMAEAERYALEEHYRRPFRLERTSSPPPPRLPNLAASVTFLRTECSPEFLAAYEREHALDPVDMERTDWVAHIRLEHQRWRLARGDAPPPRAEHLAPKTAVRLLPPSPVRKR